MLYPRKVEKALDKELFRNPSSEYRGTPFWAWNCKVTKKQIAEQTEDLRQMGMGGAHIHSRTGMNIPFMSEEFLDLVSYAHDQFAEKEMLTWLYDEDRWPSGFGGGLVTCHEEYRQRCLVFSSEPIEDGFPKDKGESISSARAIRNDSRKFLMCYGVQLNEKGNMTDYRVLADGEAIPEGYAPWYAYLEVSGDSAWFNNQAYVNTLDPKAMAFFLDTVHEKYAGKLGDSFGKDIPSIFTDEPQFVHKSRLGRADDKQARFIPYTDDFEESYRAAYGESFLEHLPEVFWEMEGKPVSVTRYHYHDHIAERFSQAFADQIGNWCEAHGFALTGHMMEEPTLRSQTAALGEAMRSYRSFQLPGIDMLCDSRELTTAKQTQSAVHQYAREGMLSELYGVTNWDFDFRNHKLGGDWQAALGVTIRVHHLTWVSMEGEAKRDYPACIGYQSPWYRKYKKIEDYFSRLNTALVRGTPFVKIGVIHPIESYWLKWGNEETTGAEREEMDKAFSDLTSWLLYGLLDFDFISESLLEEQEDNGKGFGVGAMSYDVVVVPDCLTLRKNTVERLKKFAEKGGKIFYLGHVPEYIDALPAPDDALAQTGTVLPFTKQAVREALEPYRTVSVRDRRGMKSTNLLSQQRQDGENRWLFLAHSERPANPDDVTAEYWTIRVPGNWTVELYDAMEGTISPVAVHYGADRTQWEVTSYAQDSFLYCLKPGRAEESAAPDSESAAVCQAAATPELADFVLEEPNVLVLDMAEYKMDDGEWKEKEEILRLDNNFRREAGYPMREDAYAQPWIYGERSFEHKVSLRFTISSDIELDQVELALENEEITELIWNGEKVEHKVSGYYTDREFHKVVLPGLKKGENVLEARLPYHMSVNVEAMFLLGQFGVNVKGSTAVITELPEKLGFGDICSQGLPFYGGNVVYRVPVELAGDGELSVQVPRFRNPLIEVVLDGEEGRSRDLFKSPYRVNFGQVKKGKHVIELRAYGNRRNTFGQLHNCSGFVSWCGPNAWRTTGENWAYEYQLTPTGILVSPRVEVAVETK
ncbi:type 1 glutamine amidotransferase family protein [Acetatifactor aquisgranensis]|uniref:hypothetical protein n=1 Tax=Acetatifactor aquisgranensis TaxID=2941233 RepID=UPI00203CCAA8|nr:hypothetical protein [Acetatifactor aquisgranensis]